MTHNDNTPDTDKLDEILKDELPFIEPGDPTYDELKVALETWHSHALAQAVAEARRDAFNDVIKNSVRCYDHDTVQVETPRTWLVTQRSNAEAELTKKKGQDV